MSLIQRLSQVVQGWFQPRADFQFNIKTLESLKVIAEREKRTPEEVAAQLVEDGLRRQQHMNQTLALWKSLTPREQEVTALVCLHYTNRMIAARLHISPETVKTHVAHVLVKLSLPNRNALRQLLSEWDFSEWEEKE